MFFDSLPTEKKLAMLYELQQTFIANGRFHDKELKDLLIENPLYAKCLLKCIEEVHRVYP